MSSVHCKQSEQQVYSKESQLPDILSTTFAAVSSEI